MQFRRDCSCTEDLKRQEHVGNLSGDILRHQRTACVYRAGLAPHILFVSVAAWHIFKAFETHRPTHYRILSRTTDLRRSPLAPTVTKCDENDEKIPKVATIYPANLLPPIPIKHDMIFYAKCVFGCCEKLRHSPAFYIRASTFWPCAKGPLAQTPSSGPGPENNR